MSEEGQEDGVDGRALMPKDAETYLSTHMVCPASCNACKGEAGVHRGEMELPIYSSSTLA